MHFPLVQNLTTATQKKCYKYCTQHHFSSVHLHHFPFSIPHSFCCSTEKYNGLLCPNQEQIEKVNQMNERVSEPAKKKTRSDRLPFHYDVHVLGRRFLGFSYFVSMCIFDWLRLHLKWQAFWMPMNYTMISIITFVRNFIHTVHSSMRREKERINCVIVTGTIVEEIKMNNCNEF